MTSRFTWRQARRPSTHAAAPPDTVARVPTTHPAFTPDALRRAWRRVRAAGGGGGVDGVDLAAFESRLEIELGALREDVLSGRYRPRAVRGVWVPKAGEGLRPLAVWALRDRVAQRAVHDYLEPYFEPRFLDCSHGFRPARSVDTAVRAVLAARDEGLRWVLDADIEDCFPSIDPERLVATIRASVPDPVVPALLERWCGVSTLDRDGRPRPVGISQGGVLSPLLCNIYLHAFDTALTAHGFRLVRYADDLVCLGRRKGDVKTALRVAEETLARLGMRLHPGKTQVTHFDQGFPYLGVFFLRGEHFRLSPPVGRRQGATS